MGEETLIKYHFFSNKNEGRVTFVAHKTSVPHSLQQKWSRSLGSCYGNYGYEQVCHNYEHMKSGRERSFRWKTFVCIWKKCFTGEGHGKYNYYKNTFMCSCTDWLRSLLFLWKHIVHMNNAQTITYSPYGEVLHLL